MHARIAISNRSEDQNQKKKKEEFTVFKEIRVDLLNNRFKEIVHFLHYIIRSGQDRSSLTYRIEDSH